MNRSIIIAFVSLLLLSCHTYEIVQKDDDIYVAHHTHGAIKVDGILNEKSWKYASVTPPFRELTGSGTASVYTTTACILWDEAHLYVAAVIPEQHIRATMKHHDDYLFRENDFEIFLDPQGDGRNYIELEVNALGTTTDILMPKAPSEGGEGDYEWSLQGWKCAVHCDGTLNDDSDIDYQWTVEIAIPLPSIGITHIGTGSKLRLNMMRIDREKVGGVAHYDAFQPIHDKTMHIPSRWPYILMGR